MVVGAVIVFELSFGFGHSVSGVADVEVFFVLVSHAFGFEESVYGRFLGEVGSFIMVCEGNNLG